ncbi:MAG: aspartate racemase [Lysobacterales bacterium CG17_big_fil_post_rev_8_21_14_2_50_64_11]|nr:MAG: aspartate racemase [Xanthomonadales bacterium CG17_big_fil_post_rev_8_21_14_2_50_64_11]PIX61759.1 MAG: aspartate racemase [Xanthomonadales bacterium CG_4_10_14_3_um_filter_64_11]
MRTIGLIGGMSFESTVSYYQQINRHVAAQLGGLHSAPLLLHSVEFAAIAALQAAGDWHQAGVVLAACAQGLQRAGAEGLLLCTNTMHKVAPAIEAAVDIPFLHIVDITAAAVVAADIENVALLGTRFTMEQAFYRDRLQAHGLRVQVPNTVDQDRVHRVIFDELCRGRIEPASRRAYVEIIARLAQRGAQAVILGCTEIGLLLAHDDSPLPLFDTTALHARAAAEFVLGDVCSPPAP